MMYGNKLAAAIKVNGKVLREFKDTVYIPFGSEYSILVKNLNTKRAIVNVYIDGDNVVPSGLVINAGEEVDLERWIKNGNLSEGNRFKFIERTSNIEDNRGIKIEDGLVRIEYQFALYDASRPVLQVTDNYYPNYNYGYNINSWNNSALRGMSASGSVTPMGICASGATSSIVNSSTVSYSANDTGITVPGSKSTQSFTTVSSFLTESATHSMIIKLLGETEDNKPITRPVTVKHKPKCTTCGKQNKHNAKFCSECGTALEIFA